MGKEIFFPYTDEIIFLDTEFTHLDAKKAELLSLALVKANGKEFYAEFVYDGPVHPWVKKHVQPYLTEKKQTKEEVVTGIKKFIGAGEPYLMAYVNQFDAVLWYDLFGTPNKHPANRTPIDFASILFAFGFHPNSFGRKTFWKKIGMPDIDYEGRPHNALRDAQLLRDAYKSFYQYIHTHSSSVLKVG